MHEGNKGKRTGRVLTPSHRRRKVNKSGGGGEMILQPPMAKVGGGGITLLLAPLAPLRRAHLRMMIKHALRNTYYTIAAATIVIEMRYLHRCCLSSKIETLRKACFRFPEYSLEQCG